MELKQRVRTDASTGTCLLIVPYGIETAYTPTLVQKTVSFNRTLWN